VLFVTRTTHCKLCINCNLENSVSFGISLFEPLFEEEKILLRKFSTEDTDNAKKLFGSVNLDHKDGKISIYDTGKGMDGTLENCIAKW